MDEKIKEAVRVWTISEYKNRIPAVCDPVFYLATRYLDAKCPEKKEHTAKCHFIHLHQGTDTKEIPCECGADAYNLALDDYRLWLTKKLEGLEEVIEHEFFERFGANKIWVTPSRDNVETVLEIWAFINHAIRKMMGV